MNACSGEKAKRMAGESFVSAEDIKHEQRGHSWGTGAIQVKNNSALARKQMWWSSTTGDEKCLDSGYIWKTELMVFSDLLHILREHYSKASGVNNWKDGVDIS